MNLSPQHQSNRQQKKKKEKGPFFKGQNHIDSELFFKNTLEDINTQHQEVHPFIQPKAPITLPQTKVNAPQTQLRSRPVNNNSGQDREQVEQEEQTAEVEDLAHERVVAQGDATEENEQPNSSIPLERLQELLGTKYDFYVEMVGEAAIIEISQMISDEAVLTKLLNHQIFGRLLALNEAVGPKSKGHFFQLLDNTQQPGQLMQFLEGLDQISALNLFLKETQRFTYLGHLLDQISDTSLLISVIDQLNKNGSNISYGEQSIHQSAMDNRFVNLLSKLNQVTDKTHFLSILTQSNAQLDLILSKVSYAKVIIESTKVLGLPLTQKLLQHGSVLSSITNDEMLNKHLQYIKDCQADIAQRIEEKQELTLQDIKEIKHRTSYDHVEAMESNCKIEAAESTLRDSENKSSHHTNRQLSWDKNYDPSPNITENIRQEIAPHIDPFEFTEILFSIFRNEEQQNEGHQFTLDNVDFDERNQQVYHTDSAIAPGFLYGTDHNTLDINAHGLAKNDSVYNEERLNEFIAAQKDIPEAWINQDHLAEFRLLSQEYANSDQLIPIITAFLDEHPLIDRDKARIDFNEQNDIRNDLFYQQDEHISTYSSKQLWNIAKALGKDNVDLIRVLTCHGIDNAKMLARITGKTTIGFNVFLKAKQNGGISPELPRFTKNSKDQVIVKVFNYISKKQKEPS